MLPEAEFNPAQIGDAALSDLRMRCVTHTNNAAPRFGTWLHKWCDCEQLRRVETPTKSLARHAAAVPFDVREWTDTDVGQAMYATTLLSYAVNDPGAGHLLDRLSLLLATECQRRLSGRDVANES